MLWLTATPPEDWRRRLQRGQFPGVILPVRHHGRPLPEPRLFRRWRLWSSLEEARPLSPVTAFLERVAEKEGQGLLFVPRVADVDRLLAWIKKRHPDRLAQCRGVTGREKSESGCWRSSGAGKSVFSSPPPCWKGHYAAPLSRAGLRGRSSRVRCIRFGADRRARGTRRRLPAGGSLVFVRRADGGAVEGDSGDPMDEPDGPPPGMAEGGRGK